ncbi:MAG: PorV/PorQ family protein [Elusimicrobiota bacterium]|nr:MAG: PorV/PorQ family protein [Elusimicrobiota bacterium]
MRTLALAAVLAASAAAPVRAADSNAGVSGANFLKIGQGSARAMALGGAFVALAEGSDAMAWNPAGLAVTQQRELGFSYLRYIQDVDSPLYLGYAHPMGRTTWGANLSYLSVSGFDIRDAQGVPQPETTVGVRDAQASIGIARSFWYEKLFLGSSLRVVHEDIAGSVKNTVVGDFGAILKPNPTLSLGFSVQNFGTGSANVARITRGGAGLRLGDFVTLGLELNKATDASARIGFGGEFQLPEEYLDVGQLSFRIGYRNGDSFGQSYDETLRSLRLDRASNLSFGFGMYTSQAFGYGVSLDYAFVPMGALGTVDQISIKMKF